MSDKLKKNILATIIYYDGLNYPVTIFEVWKYLIRTDYHTPTLVKNDVSLSIIFKQLQAPDLAKYVEHSRGFYFLKGRSELVIKRIENGKISTGKIKKLRKIANLLKFIPFVRMVAITGALAMKNARTQSDWDLLIVTKYGKIWTGRTLVTILLHLIKKRRHDGIVADRACLNFFVTEDTLEVITKDLFSASEYMFITPLFDFKTFTRFQIKNQWIKNMKPSYGLDELEPLGLISDSKFARFARNLGETILGSMWIENFLKKIELKRINLNPKTHQDGSLVYANDDALIFLPCPHGPKVFEKFKEKIEQLSA